MAVRRAKKGSVINIRRWGEKQSYQVLETCILFTVIIIYSPQGLYIEAAHKRTKQVQYKSWKKNEGKMMTSISEYMKRRHLNPTRWMTSSDLFFFFSKTISKTALFHFSLTSYEFLLCKKYFKTNFFSSNLHSWSIFQTSTKRNPYCIISARSSLFIVAALVPFLHYSVRFRHTLIRYNKTFI